MVVVVDDLGRPVSISGAPSRVVSLIPSVTELLFALGVGKNVVGATRFCTEPPAARRIARVGGTKNPDIEGIRRLAPDLVLASAEENRREDIEVLASHGLPAYVMFPRTVDAAIRLVEKLGLIFQRPEVSTALAERLAGARSAVAADAALGPRPRVFCPIWKRPWMTFNRDTFAHDMLATAGGQNIFAGLAERYAIIDADMVARLRPDVVLLPSEPYRFRARDVPDVEELLAGAGGVRPAVRFVDGRALAWYGPRIGSGLWLLRSSLTPSVGPGLRG